MEELGGLVTTLVGMILGAALHYWFTRTQERHKQTEVLRAQAYADYLRSVAQIDAAARFGREKPEELISSVIEVKARIAIYGTTHVGEALARFQRSGAVVSGEGEELFLDLCHAMRADSAAGEDPLAREDLAAIVLQVKEA